MKEFLEKNAKKLGILVSIVLGASMIVVSMVPGCESSVDGLRSAKTTVESVGAALPGEDAPAGSR